MSTFSDRLNKHEYPAQAVTVPVRKLTTKQALDLIAYYLACGHITLLDPEIVIQFTQDGRISVPDPNPNDATFPRVRTAAIISGVHYVYNNNPQTSKTLWHLDPAMVVFLYRLANFLKKWGVTQIHHMGIAKECKSPNTRCQPPCPCDQHQMGRAIDFAGVTGEVPNQLSPSLAGPYSIDVHKDWGRQPVPIPGEAPHIWRAGVETSYRLKPVTDPDTPEKVKKFLAYWIFQDVYNFAAREAVDRGSSTQDSSPTTIGQSSECIIHPDYRTDRLSAFGRSLAKEHVDHIHIEIGPSGFRS